MLAIGIQSASAMSAPIRGFDKCFMFNRLDIAKTPRCERFRHTHRGVQLGCGAGISLRNPNRALKFDKDKASAVEFAWRTRELAAKKLQVEPEEFIVVQNLACCQPLLLPQSAQRSLAPRSFPYSLRTLPSRLLDLLLPARIHPLTPTFH
jgi:hypothetical protein